MGLGFGIRIWDLGFWVFGLVFQVSFLRRPFLGRAGSAEVAFKNVRGLVKALLRAVAAGAGLQGFCVGWFKVERGC